MLYGAATLLLFQICKLILAQTTNPCINNGTWVASGCQTDAHCTPYSILPTVCLNTHCCTTSNVPIVTTTPVNVCINGGTFIRSQCSNSNQCALYTSEPVACYNGTCCTVPQRCPNGKQPLAVGCTLGAQCLLLTRVLPTYCNGGLCCSYF